MRDKNKIRKIFAFALAGALFTGICPPLPTALADHEEEIQDARDKVDEYQESLNQVNSSLESLENEKNDTMSEISRMDALSQEVTQTMLALNQDIEKSNRAIEKTTEELTEAQDLADEQYRSMKKRIQYMYEYGEVSYLDMILGGGSISDILNRIIYVSEVSEYDREKLIEYRDIVKAVREKNERLISEKDILEQQESVQENSLAEIEKIAQEKSERLNSLAGEISQGNQQAQRLQQDIKEGEQEIAELEYLMEQEAEAAKQAALEAARIAAEKAAKEAAERKAAQEESSRQAALESSRAESLRQESIAASLEESRKYEESLEASRQESIEESRRQEAEQNNTSDSAEDTLPDASEYETDETGETETTVPETPAPSETTAYSGESDLYFHWPVPGHDMVTSGFGPRPDAPVEGVALFHNAIDIAAPFGSDIVAVQDGVVIYAGDGIEVASSSGGYQVWISHDNGRYITMYMHCSTLLVGIGDSVSAGQTIALVGNTGLSAGYHLDFRILYGSDYIDPLGGRVTYSNY